MDFKKSFIDAMVRADCAPARDDDILDTGLESRLIQAANDRNGSKSLYYSFEQQHDKAFGHWYSCRTGSGDSWFSRSGTKWTDAERDAWKAEQEAKRAAIEEEKQLRYENVANESAARWKSLSKAETHPYLEAKGIGPNSARVDRDALVICGIDATWKNWTLQEIYPDKSKKFSWGGKKKGSFFPIGVKKSDTPDTIFIGEGFATCASVFEITGVPVLVAFDDTNLFPVACAARIKWPDARIILIADNDKYDKKTGGVRELNPGIHWAKQAATKIGGFVIWPEFPDDDIVNTDFNDAANVLGHDYVRDRLANVLEKLSPEQDEAQDTPDTTPENPLSVEYQNDVGGDFNPLEDDEMKGDFNLPLRVLGFDEEYYYYYSFIKMKIIQLKITEHTMNHLKHFASDYIWKTWATGGKGTNISDAGTAAAASDALIQLAHKRGYFQIADKVRGSGAWMDAGRAVLHCGDCLYVDGVYTDLRKIKSSYVYTRSSSLLSPSLEALSSKEAAKLRTLCESLCWENKLSGSLLAGWIVIAPICAMLKWRPHIWITGQSGSGKSTAINDITKPLLGPIAMKYDGGTTEAAIRETMKHDGRPIIYDEAEPSTTMDGIMKLTRLASSGSIVTKYHQIPFNARFCACFSSINPPIKDYADETRISLLILKKNMSYDKESQYARIQESIAEIVTEDFSNGLLARTISNMENLLANILIFNEAARAVFGDSRAADQISPMLAGLYLLSGTGLVEFDKAKTWIEGQDWTLHTAITADPDYSRLLQHICLSIVSIKGANGYQDFNVGQLVSAIIRDDPQATLFSQVLRLYGVMVTKDGVIISNQNQNLARFLKGTDWETNWSRTLSDFPGAERTNPLRFGDGQSTRRGIRIPLSAFLE